MPWTIVAAMAPLMYNLATFWQNLVALGGAKTGELHAKQVDAPDTDRLWLVGMHAVPARVNQLNVVNTGREA